VIDAALAEVEPHLSLQRACALLGRPRASHYRCLRLPVERVRRLRAAPPNALPALSGSRSWRCCAHRSTATWRSRRSGPVSSTTAATTARSPACIGSCAPPGRSENAARKPPTRRRSSLNWSPPSPMSSGRGTSPSFAVQTAASTTTSTSSWTSTAATSWAGPSRRQSPGNSPRTSSRTASPASRSPATRSRCTPTEAPR